MSDSPWIFSATDETFQQEVIERSQSQLVLLDFWASWCGPCRQLGPVLERLANEAAGQFALVKVNTEEAPQAATMYGIASIPTVLALLGGQVLDAFEGALPEQQIRQWLSKLSTAQELKQAEQLADSDPTRAVEILRNLHTTQPRNHDVSMALLNLHWRLENTQECQLLLDEMEQQAPLEPEAQKIRAALSLQAKASIDVSEARAKAEAEPKNWPAQLELAQALVGQQAYQSAFDICLNLVMLDRKQTGEQARALMVEVFQALPDDSTLTSEYRRKLASALY